MDSLAVNFAFVFSAMKTCSLQRNSSYGDHSCDWRSGGGVGVPSPSLLFLLRGVYMQSRELRLLRFTQAYLMQGRKNAHFIFKKDSLSSS